ncbi:WhiB family transcriptional regulator [Streptomyces sp. NPDC093591]|uniref:WhiB family transcriptional regulator n=1 Tax=Streptomyces sp. NPDC093591 TaxID=3366044 RepID=UPI0038198F06
MSNYTGSVPDTEPARTWLPLAACIGHNDAMFPDNNQRRIAEAKRICRPCPVWRECLNDALNTGDNNFGVRGGLTDKERRALAKKRAQQGSPVEPPKPKPEKQPPPATLAEAFARRTTRTENGHVLWYGARQMKFQGEKYTSLRVAFLLGHGREPEGPVRRTCGIDCHRADHLTDGRMRDEGALCGTRQGYQRHKKHKEPACLPCKRANTDADNRLRRTGTTKVAA